MQKYLMSSLRGLHVQHDAGTASHHPAHITSKY